MQTDQTSQVLAQLINFWETNNKNISAFFSKHNEDTYLGPVAPERNTGLYLLGHLIAVSDDLFSILDLGEILYPELAKYAGESESKIAHPYSISELKEKWEALNAKLTPLLKKQVPEWWLGRHMRVSEADFALDPSRNKLNVLLSRGSHENYHRGQLVFLTERQPA